MPISREDVMHIAALCRIRLGDEEIARLQDQLSNILQQFDALKQLDTTNVPPTAQTLDIRNVLREDESRPSLPREDVLRNAPHQDEDHIKIHAVLEE